MALQPFPIPGPATFAPFSTHSSQLDTPVPSQPLCYQSHPHAFRHLWGCVSVFTSDFELSALNRSSRQCPYQYHSKCFSFPLFSYSYALFCTGQNAIFNLFSFLRTLCRKHPGWGERYRQFDPVLLPAKMAMGRIVALASFFVADRADLSADLFGEPIPSFKPAEEINATLAHLVRHESPVTNHEPRVTSHHYCPVIGFSVMRKPFAEMVLGAKRGEIDLNLHWPGKRVFPFFGEDFAHEFGKNHFRAVDGFCSRARVSPLRRALSRQSQGHEFFLLGPVFVHGLCTTDVPQKFARYRNLFAHAGRKTVSPGHPRPRLAQHAGGCQRDARLAHLRRPGTCAHRSSTCAVCRRTFRRGVGGNRLRAGLHDHRFVSFAVSLGALPALERGCEDAYAARSARQHSFVYRCFSRQNPRNSYPRSVAPGTRRALSDGPRLSRFHAPLHADARLGFFHPSLPERFRLPAPRVSCGRRGHGSALRSNHSAEKFYSRTWLPRSVAAYLLCRFPNRKTPHLFDQQFSVPGSDRRATLQMPLADRTVLQVDQTTSAHRKVLWSFRERRQNANLDGYLGLLAVGGGQTTPAAGAQSVLHFANSQCQPVRENPTVAGTYQFRAAKS